jgi:hypothetical protein
MKSKNFLSLELRNPVASPGVAQIKKNSTVSERSRHLPKDALGPAIPRPNAVSGR